jgi:competence protein ComEC
MRLVYLALGWTTGIFLAPSLPAFMWQAWLFFALLACAGVSAFWHTRARWLWLALLCALLGGLRYSLMPQTSALVAFNGRSVAVEGVIASAPDVRDTFTQVRLEAERLFDGRAWHDVDGIALARLAPQTPVRYGQRVQLGGEMLTPFEGDTFSYADYLARQGVFSFFPSATYTLLAENSPDHWTALYALRERAEANVNAALPEPFAGLLVGILLGNERGMSPDLAQAFSVTGTAHIIAISGFNMAVISGVLMRLFGRLPSARAQTVGAWVAVGVLVLYTLLVGANAAVVRSAVMSSLLLIAPLLKRKTYLPASLAFVVLVMSAFNPAVLWDVSFQLSFCAVLGMMLFVAPLERAMTHAFGQRAGLISESLTVTLAAQIATTPLIALYFQKFSVLSLLVNLLVIPVQTFVLIGGLLALLTSFALPVVAQALFWAVMVGLGWTITLVRSFAQVPLAEVAVYVDPRLVGAFYVCLIGGAIMAGLRPTAWIGWIERLRRRALLTVLATGTLCLGVLLFSLRLSVPDGMLHVWWLAMGQSNAVLIQTPNGAHILLDGGRYPSRLLTALGDRMPFYDRELELLILTHPDDNDNSALLRVLERYRVGAWMHNGQPQLGEVQSQLRALLADVPQVVVTAGYRVQTSDGVTIEILHPSNTPQIGAPLGDGALLLRVTYGAHSFLLTSDLTREGQKQVMAMGQYPLADVMQLPDHATARSLDEGFVALVQPRVVVVQYDVANRRGDPDAGTLFTVRDALLLRADKNNVHLFSDGQTLWQVYD